MEYLPLRIKLKLLILGVGRLWFLRWKAWLYDLGHRKSSNDSENVQSKNWHQFAERRRELSINFPSIARNIGWWIAGVNFGILIIIVLTWQIYVGFIYKGTGVENPGPGIATIMPTPAAKTSYDPLSTYEYISTQESENLRTQPNVLNLAVLGGGHGARYMKNYAVVLDHHWVEAQQVFGITGFSPGDTSFTIKVDVSSYTLNHFQGFILADLPERIYIVSEDNRIWQIPLSEDLLVPLPEAQEKLVVDIPPNPQLSLTYQ